MADEPTSDDSGAPAMTPLSAAMKTHCPELDTEKRGALRADLPSAADNIAAATLVVLHHSIEAAFKAKDDEDGREWLLGLTKKATESDHVRIIPDPKAFLDMSNRALWPAANGADAGCGA